MSEPEALNAMKDAAFLERGGEMGQRLRDFDWSRTPLGEPSAWPPVLTTLVALLLASKQPMFLAWGGERTWLYNDAFIPIAGRKHPACLGHPAEDVWPEAWNDLEPLFARVFAGEPVQIFAYEVGVDRRGVVENAVFDFSYTPIRSHNGGVDGLFGVCTERTERDLEERRRLAMAEAGRDRLFELSRDLIGVASFDGFLKGINPAWSSELGWSEEELLTRPFSEIIHPDDLAVTAEVLEVLRKGEAVNQFRVRLLRSDGVAVPFAWSAVPEAHAGERTFYTVGRDISNDASEVRRSEARLRFLDTLTRTVSPLDDADRILAATTQMTAKYLGVSSCAYADMDSDQDGFTIRADWARPGSESIVGHYSLADFGRLAVTNLGDGRPLIINDNRVELAPEEAATFQAIGILATICMPLVKDGRLIALMAVHDAAPRMWTDDELALVSEVTERSWAHVERVGAEGNLRSSNARFQAAVNAVEGVVWTNDADGRMTGEQPGWTGLTGQSKAEYQGFGWTAAVHPDDAEPTLQAWNEAVRERKPFLFEHRIHCVDGVWRTFSIRAIPVLNSDRSIVEWVGVHTDVTDQRAAEAELRELNSTLERRVADALAERRLLADLVEGTDAFVQVVDFQFHWVAINRAAANEFERIYGLRPKVGLSMLDLLKDQPEHREQVRLVWARALAGEQFTETGEFGDPDRDRRYYEMKYNVLRDGSGHQIGAYQFVYDVTDRVREQERLVSAEAQLRQAQKMEAMGQLTGGVAHDFNNLLTPILGGLDILQRRGVGGEREQRLIAGAIQSAERAKTLVQRLLAFARRQPLQPTAVDVGELVREMAELIAITIGPQITVRVEVEDELPLATADPNQLEMALLNLAVNARDAMDNHGTLRLTVTAAEVTAPDRSDLRPGRYVRISVADTGGGMDEATLARAIEPFFSTKGVGKGTGLGLSMVHGLAEQLGGGLTIESWAGLGTNVELWLPESTDGVTTRTAAPPRAFKTPRKGAALLVDDEESVRATTAEMLKEIGFDVHEASSAEDALAMVEAGLRPTLVVTDHLMPGMTGVDLAGTLKLSMPGVPVLLVSGYADHAGVAAGLPLLNKPFRSTDLARSVALLTGEAVEETSD